MAWNGSDGKPKVAISKNQRTTTRLNWLGIGVVAAIVLVLALVALWILGGKDSDGSDAPRKPPSNAEHPRKTQPPKPTATQAESDDTAQPTVAASESVPETPKTPEEIEAEERKKDPLYDRHHIVAKMPLVKEPIEQLMLTVFETELGDMPPMLPAIPAFDEERFNKLVNLQTLPEEGDSKEALLSKELVNQVKAELSKYLKEGGTTSGFLAYYVNELDSAFHERETCKELVMKSMKTDEPELAREMFNKFNERLSSKGIKPLTLTRRQKEYLGIQEEQQ